MTKIVLDVNQCFFSGNDVETKLTTLEMLKEQFAAHEGKNWLVNGFEFGCPAALPMVFNVNPQELQLSVPWGTYSPSAHAQLESKHHIHGATA